MDRYNICPLLTDAIHGQIQYISDFDKCNTWTNIANFQSLSTVYKELSSSQFWWPGFFLLPAWRGFSWLNRMRPKWFYICTGWKNIFIWDGFCKKITIPETDGWEHKIVQKPAMIQQSYTDHYCFQSTPPDFLVLFLLCNNASMGYILIMPPYIYLVLGNFHHQNNQHYHHYYPFLEVGDLINWWRQ